MTSSTEEVKKDTMHNTNVVVSGLDKYDFFTQEEKDKLENVIRREIMEQENIIIRYTGFGNPNGKVEDMLNKDMQTLQNILKKINNDT